MMRKEIYKAITEQTLIAQLTKSFVLSKKEDADQLWMASLYIIRNQRGIIY